MKSLAELQEIRDRTLGSVTLRKEGTDEVRVVVGMATCGIAAGARSVMSAFVEELAKKNPANVTVTQMGCIGKCRLEPIVEIIAPGEEKVTYVKMTPEKARRVVEEHIVNKQVVTEYTIGAAE